MMKDSIQPRILASYRLGPHSPGPSAWREVGSVHLLKFVICLLFFMAVTGCGTYRPPLKKEVPFLERAQTQMDGNLEVTVAVPDERESKEVFGIPLSSGGIQLVWVHIKNGDDKPYWFLPGSLDPNYFSPFEVAYKYRDSIHDSIYTDIQKKSLPHLVEPGAEVSGYVFTNLVEGTKEVNIALIGHHQFRKFVFFIPVPGLRLDHEQINFGALYEGKEIVFDNKADLRAALEKLPCCTTNADGTVEGDPLNLIVVGSPSQILSAFTHAGWHETEIITAETEWRAATAFLTGRSEEHLPISPLYYSQDAQHLGLQKPRRTISARNHLRLWLTPMQYGGRSVWIGQISRDVGVRFTLKTWPPFTHKIDPYVDDARGYLIEDLMMAHLLAEFGFVGGVGVSAPSAPRRNLTGDPYFTDGFRGVMILANEPTPLDRIRLLRWEWPPRFGAAPERFSSEGER